MGNVFNNIAGNVVKYAAADNTVAATLVFKYNQFLGNAKVTFNIAATNADCEKNYANVDYNNAGNVALNKDNDYATAEELTTAYAAYNAPVEE